MQVGTPEPESKDEFEFETEGEGQDPAEGVGAFGRVCRGHCCWGILMLLG